MHKPFGLLAAIVLLGTVGVGLADVPRQSPLVELFTNTS